MDAFFERADWLYAGLVLLVALNPRARYRPLAGAGLGLVLLAAASERVAGPSSGTTFATVNEVMVAAGASIVVIAGLLALRRARQDPSTAPHDVPPEPARSPDPIVIVGLALAGLAPHLLLMDLGVLLMLVGAVRATIRSRRLGWLAILVVAGGLLGASLVLLTTIQGPGAGSMSLLRDGPFSPAAERLLVLLLGAGTLLLTGVPPLHRAPWGTLLSPLAAILMIRVGLVALPGGIREWQPLAMLLLAGAGITAALLRRWGPLALAGGLAALWSGIPTGVVAAALLVLWGWLLDQGGAIRGLPRLPERWSGLLMVVPAFAAFPALEAALGAQVVIPVGFVAGVIVALLRPVPGQPGAARAPLY